MLSQDAKALAATTVAATACAASVAAARTTVAFTTAANSPMGYGIGAIVADEAADPISLEEAGHIAQQRDEARRNPASQVAPHPAAHGSAEQ